MLHRLILSTTGKNMKMKENIYLQFCVSSYDKHKHMSYFSTDSDLLLFIIIIVIYDGYNHRRIKMHFWLV